jgi:hypothetical protein
MILSYYITPIKRKRSMGIYDYMRERPALILPDSSLRSRGYYGGVGQGGGDPFEVEQKMPRTFKYPLIAF